MANDRFELKVEYDEVPSDSFSTSPLVGAGSDTESSGVNYPNGNPFTAKAQQESNASEPIDSGIWLLDIAQSHHYTIQIEGLQSYYTPEKSFSAFLPVKNIQLNQTSYENMSIPLSIFGDFP